MSSTRGLVADSVRSSVVDGPGNRYVLFLQGCTFNCLACHNPQTIPRHTTATSHWRKVDEIVAEVAEVAPFLSGVTVSGGEASSQWRFVHELFEALASVEPTAHLTRLVDTNGDADPHVWDILAASMHGAMVDLKALDPEVHRMLTGRDNDRVLASIRQLSDIGRLHEVRLLIIPEVNDDVDQLRATAAWLAALDPVPAVVVQGFNRHGARPVARRWSNATRGHLDAAAATLRANGVDPGLVTIRDPLST